MLGIKNGQERQTEKAGPREKVSEPVPESRVHFFLAQSEVTCPRWHSLEVTARILIQIFLAQSKTGSPAALSGLQPVTRLPWKSAPWHWEDLRST